MLGGLFSICNVYLGLKVGVSINMSITAALLGCGFWAAARGASGGQMRPWNILENNINQTACSSGASVASAGLVHAVPAVVLLTEKTLSWSQLALWIFSVCLVGIVVAVVLRRQLVVAGNLAFPVGIASAEMLREVHSRGREAMARVKVFVSSAVVGALVFVATTLGYLRHLALPFSIRGLSAKALTFSLDPALLWVGVGGLIGFRACASIMIGCVVSLGLLAPALVQNGTIELTVAQSVSDLPPEVVLPEVPAQHVTYDSAEGVLRASGVVGDAQAAELRSHSDDAKFLGAVEALVAKSRAPYSALQQWLLWPGVALMVVSSLTSLAFSWRSVVGAFGRGAAAGPGRADAGSGAVSWTWFVAGLGIALVLSVVLQVSLFEIAMWAAVLGVLLAFVLAVVAARVSGETGITPVGSMGKVSQLVFGGLIPKNPVPNLMAANVAGGAASQCADLLHDLKCGHLLGASPRLQTLAQLCGALVGAAVGSAAYMILIPNPQEQLMTAEWPAAGVAVWKAVADLFSQGFEALPAGAPLAMLLGACAGVVLTGAERFAPAKVRRFMLSPASLGLAFVIPAFYSISLFLGGVIALVVSRTSPKWSKRFLVAVCAGVVAGDSITGVGISLQRIVWP